MTSFLARLSLAATMSVVTLPLGAHHSMSAVFDFSRRVTRTGILAEVDWRNPHIYIFVDAESDDGQVERWAYEGPSPVVFRRIDNVGRERFEGAVGMTVTIDASRARDGSRTGLIRTITFPDGAVVTLCPNNC